MQAHYVFRVRFQLSVTDVEADPDTFETVVRAPAAPPGDDDGAWRFFEEWLSVTVRSVRFSELVVDEAYRDAWTDAVAAEVDRYNASTAREVRHQHLGSSLRVVE